MKAIIKSISIVAGLTNYMTCLGMVEKKKVFKFISYFEYRHDENCAI